MPIASRAKVLVIWCVVICALITPVAIAATSPLQARRDAAYITGGMAGVVALSLLAAQPLLAAGYLPGLHKRAAQRLHLWLGGALIICVAVHIGGLYLSSPMVVLDALLLTSPTPFSVYGVIATVAVALTGLLVQFRRLLRLRPTIWRILHNLLALAVVGATVVHAVMIDGAMGDWSKWLISALATCGALFTVVHLRLIKPGRRAM